LNQLADHAELLQAAALSLPPINSIASPPASRTSSSNAPIVSENLGSIEFQQPAVSPTDGSRYESTNNNSQPASVGAATARTIEAVTVQPARIRHFFNM
jgi:hypothetical protein